MKKSKKLVDFNYKELAEEKKSMKNWLIFLGVTYIIYSFAYSFTHDEIYAFLFILTVNAIAMCFNFAMGLTIMQKIERKK